MIDTLVAWIRRYGILVAIGAIAWMAFAQPRVEAAGYGILGWVVVAVLVAVVGVDVVMTVREWE